jgi:hypothetical protein
MNSPARTMNNVILFKILEFRNKKENGAVQRNQIVLWVILGLFVKNVIIIMDFMVQMEFVIGAKQHGK